MTSPEHITIPIRGRQLPLIPVVTILLPLFLFTFGLLLGYACQTGAL
ncbi:hypothetical protein AVANI_31 [Mycobacterium phage Avani]|uniref:Uncharacterized protein n=2 Tax=Avanivirus TaxID=2843352 RepID=Q855T2_9CAUD|nr:hypothetical protein PBI_CHE9D_31 [Mycobacterium phage Che9d]YP_009013126.1 hypothetical protein CL78_gp031 [Mycobacterium phage Avani]AAN07949.1 hypothetical protein PBI_CHE9D_31 [Mycobacterium phage Che9d]AFL47945.1 hypothetical protein AVANI_31 [Mycobacterium phage Avani]